MRSYRTISVVSLQHLHIRWPALKSLLQHIQCGSYNSRSVALLKSIHITQFRSKEIARLPSILLAIDSVRLANVVLKEICTYDATTSNSTSKSDRFGMNLSSKIRQLIFYSRTLSLQNWISLLKMILRRNLGSIAYCFRTAIVICLQLLSYLNFFFG